jgi:glycosyltransferase involved in cell wall biosynthesis/tetratricopeptide (TPR) repeat protein
MNTLVTFATRWGPQFGGINSFNQDFLTAIAAASLSQINVICIVLFANEQDIKNAKLKDILLISLDLKGQDNFLSSFEPKVWSELTNIPIEPGSTVWLGHDRITGDIALKAASDRGGRSALIHHMSYDCYEAFTEDSLTAREKVDTQKRLFKQANIALAVGPLLKNELQDMLDTVDVTEIIPGLPEISVRKRAPNTFRAFISGRLNQDAKKIKQGHLGVAAFASAIKKTDEDTNLPDILNGENQPEITLRGVDFELITSGEKTDGELDLKLFAQEYAQRVIRLHVLPFTQDRGVLFDDLSKASVAMMPSWHEGFGLVAWEAIAAGIPLIVSNKSGVYQLLKEYEDGLYTNSVTAIDIRGNNVPPFFQELDLDDLSNAIINIAKDPKRAREKAIKLREKLCSVFTWKACADSFVSALDWTPPETPIPTKNTAPILVHIEAPTENISTQHHLAIPSASWKEDAGLSKSVLLRAEEAILPFHQGRQPFLEEQYQWACSKNFNIATRLLTGLGGTGKTRLAIELCKKLQSDGWHTGFWSPDTSCIDLLAELIRIKKDTCLVIDYAETRQQPLLSLLKLLLNKSFEFKVRILLLARDSGEWWSLLPAKDSSCQALLDGNATTGPYGLPPLHTTSESRIQAYEDAMQTYAVKLNKQPVKAQPTLSDPLFEHPLYIQMAALLALFGEQPESAEGVARALVGHERRYWKQATNDNNSALLMTLATLIDGISTTREIETLWKNIGEDKVSLRTLFNTLTPLYPDIQGLSGLKPDLLGEALGAQFLLSEQGPEVVNAILKLGSQENRVACLTVLARILKTRSELEYRLLEPILDNFIKNADVLIAVILEVPGHFAKLIEKIFLRLNKKDKIQACGILNKHFGNNCIIPLIDLEVIVRHVQLEQCNNKKDVKSLDKRCRALGNLGFVLKEQGQFAKAETYSHQALKIAEKLATMKPSRAFDMQLANILNNYAIALGENCKFEEALFYSKSSLAMTKRLAKVQPDHFESHMATSLNTYAAHLCDVGKHDEALIIFKEAMEIRKKIAKNNSVSFEAKLANSIENYASSLSECGDPGQGVIFLKEALNIRKKLVKYKPEIFEPSLAYTLNTYSQVLKTIGESDEALDIAKKSLEIINRLANNKPEIFEVSLAQAHDNVSTQLLNIGNLDEASNHSFLTLQTYRKLAEVKPLIYQHGYYLTLIDSYITSWLRGNSIDVPTEIFDLNFIFPRKKHEIEFLRIFLQFLSTKEIQPHTVDKSWLNLDKIQKLNLQELRFILSDFSEKQGVTLQLANNWKNDLATFSQQRKGNMPWWMLEVARRLDISLNVD